MPEQIFIVKVTVNFDYANCAKEDRPKSVPKLELLEKLILDSTYFKWTEDDVIRYRLYNYTKDKACNAFRRINRGKDNVELNILVDAQEYDAYFRHRPLDQYHQASIPQFLHVYESALKEQTDTIKKLEADTEKDWDVFTETMFYLGNEHANDVDTLSQGAILIGTSKDALIEELDNEIQHLQKEHFQLSADKHQLTKSINARENLLQVLKDQNKDLKIRNAELLAKQTQYVPNFVLVLIPE